jgi:hypothetical protein
MLGYAGADNRFERSRVATTGSTAAPRNLIRPPYPPT